VAESKTIVVTGGTGALGSAVTESLLAEGHRVAATWIVEADAERLAERSDPSFLAVRADVTDPASIDRALEDVRSKLGPIDGLVHLVGAWAGGMPAHQHPVERWDAMLELNLTSAFLSCRAVLPDMIERNHGRIVLVSSRTAHADRSGQIGYAVAKAGVEVVAQTIAEETRDHDVTANVIAPSTLDTPANRAAMPDARTDAWVTLDEVAAAISFLVGDSAGALRGAVLPVYGGV
jgi:NAD(P)-dependent dehydrogenase (short-subunit alcohol dehydrogenase family)